MAGSRVGRPAAFLFQRSCRKRYRVFTKNIEEETKNGWILKLSCIYDNMFVYTKIIIRKGENSYANQ